MTRKEKKQEIASKLYNLSITIKRLSSKIDNLLDMQAVKYLETRDNTLFRLLEVQVVLNRQFAECVIEYNNFVEV